MGIDGRGCTMTSRALDVLQVHRIIHVGDADLPDLRLMGSFNVQNREL